MFPSRTELLKGIDCPGINRGKCKLPHCPFRHSRPTKPASDPTSKPVNGMPGASRPTPEAKDRPVKRPRRVSPTPEPQLVPQTLMDPSCTHPVRLQHLGVIHSKLEDSGLRRCKQLAIELEAKECQNSTPGTYKMNVRNLIRKISRGEFNKPGPDSDSGHVSHQHKVDEQLASLVIPKEKLKRYIMEIPDGEFEPHERFVCDRCSQNTRFDQIVPNLREGRERCRFHLLRRLFDPEKKRLEQTFPCCGATLDEQGCQSRSTHVYKLVEPSALHAKIPFLKTPDHDHGLFAVALDCEMAYTTNGMELIRVTAMDWHTNKVVLDRIVKPQGEVLDLNTRFSGVSDLSQGITVDGQYYTPVTFEEAQSLMCDILSAKTILVGHGLENDLIIMRLVHQRIVDTALLYPRVKTRTHSLKQLAWMYLSRTIQVGEHDSMEDSLTAMDIVKKDIERRLDQLDQ